MAPGIRPAATSPLMKSSIDESFSADSTAPGFGPNRTSAASDGPVARTETIAALNNVIEQRSDADLRRNIGMPDRSIGRNDVIALLAGDPDAEWGSAAKVVRNRD